MDTNAALHLLPDLNGEVRPDRDDLASLIGIQNGPELGPEAAV